MTGIGDVFQQTVLDGSMLAAIPLAVIAGFVSFASPCVLPLVPGYLGFVSGMAGARGSSAGVRAPRLPPAGPDHDGALQTPAAQSGGTLTTPPRTGGLQDVGRGRLLLGVVLFVLGFTVVFVAFGVLAGTLGSALLEWSDVLTRVLGAVVVVMGLVFVGWVPLGQRERRIHLAPVAGLWGAPLLGVVFGLGWAPCIGPTLVAVYTLALDEASAGRGAVLSVAYALGLGLPFVLIGLGMERSTTALGFLRRHRVAIMRTGGVVLVLIGLALMTGVWAAWTQSLQGLIGGFETVV